MLLLAGWCLLLFFYGLDAGPLYRTESLRAIIGASCLEGNWLYPVLYGEPFLTKPPGHYAAIGLCSLPFGQVTEATARLPSAIAATAAVFLIFGLFRRALGEPPALLAALLLPASVMWLDKVPSAEIDMTLVGWVTAALVLLHKAIGYASGREGKAPAEPQLQALQEPRPPVWGVMRSSGSALLWIAAPLCVAAGTLTKWPAPVFFYLTAIPLLAWRRQLRLLFGWRHLLAVGIAVVVLVVWAFAVSQQVGWEILSETIRKEAAYRFTPKASSKGYRWSEVVTYPLIVLAAHLPLSLFAIRTLRPGFASQWDHRGRLLLQFLHCWTWPNLIFWAIVPNHSIRYALPISPGLMGLGVMGVLSYLANAERERGGESLTRSPALGVRHVGLRHKRLLLALLLVWLVAKVVFVEIVIPHRLAGRKAEATAARLRELVPPGEIVYLCRLKDEGVMFYYGRAARKVADLRELPRPAYVVLIEQEWRDRAAFGDAELVEWTYDQQGDPLILARIGHAPAGP